MLLTSLVQHRLQLARVALQQRSMLPIWYRQAIYHAFGPRYYGFSIKQSAPADKLSLKTLQRYYQGHPVYEDAPVLTAQRTAGHNRRATLMLKTLEYANAHIYGWSVSSYENTIHCYLDAIRDVLSGSDWREVTLPPVIDHYDAYVPGDFVCAATGYAWEHLKRDTEYLLHPLEPERDDGALKPFRLDTAELVAIAIQSNYADQSQLFLYQPVHTQTLRFWEWWLDQAVPDAWNAVPTPSA